MTEAKRKEKINELMNKISLSLKDANLQQGFEIICNRISELEKENEELKKNALVWHKVTCHEPDENGYITDDNPAEEGKEYLFKLKNGSVIIEELYYEDGYIVEGYSWEEIEAWAELSEM